DGSEWEQPLGHEFAYTWARAMIGLYRTPERNEVFKLVALRSAEVDCVNNALKAGVSEADLREGKLEPSLVHLRRAAPGQTTSATGGARRRGKHPPPAQAPRPTGRPAEEGVVPAMPRALYLGMTVLLLPSGPAPAGAPPGPDANAALKYWQAFTTLPRLTAAE